MRMDGAKYGSHHESHSFLKILIEYHFASGQSMLPLKAGQGHCLLCPEDVNATWSHCFSNQLNPCRHRPDKMLFLVSQQLQFLF